MYRSALGVQVADLVAHEESVAFHEYHGKGMREMRDGLRVDAHAVQISASYKVSKFSFWWISGLSAFMFLSINAILSKEARIS